MTSAVFCIEDAASCAIYGSRAAYGVILVTTKKGNSEKLTINYNNNFSLRPEYTGTGRYYRSLYCSTGS